MIGDDDDDDADNKTIREMYRVDAKKAAECDI